MDKKISLAIFIILFACFVYPAEITVDNVYLNEQIKIDANFEGAGIDNNTLCQFLFYDTTNNFLISRATDEYSLDNNHVYSIDFTITEPPFFRDSNYTITIMCGNITRTTTFNLLNRRTLDNFFFGELLYMKNSSDLFPYVVIIIFVVIVITAYIIHLFTNSGTR